MTAMFHDRNVQCTYVPMSTPDFKVFILGFAAGCVAQTGSTFFRVNVPTEPLSKLRLETDSIPGIDWEDFVFGVYAWFDFDLGNSSLDKLVSNLGKVTHDSKFSSAVGSAAKFVPAGQACRALCRATSSTKAFGAS